jgi:hypothetical protein
MLRPPDSSWSNSIRSRDLLRFFERVGRFRAMQTLSNPGSGLLGCHVGSGVSFVP